MIQKHPILHRARRAAPGVCAALAALQLTVSAQTLVNRYSFSETDDGAGNLNATVHDSVGGANGTLPYGGTFTGTQLQMQGGLLQYVNLTAGILSNYTAVTVDVWAAADSGLAWASFLFGFGGTDGSGAGDDYIFGSLARQYACISGADPGYNGEQGTSQGAALNNGPVHFTAVFDPPDGYVALYTNGVLQSINRNVTTPLSAVQDTESYINRSLYSSDPYSDLNIDEFRIWNGALNALQIAGSDVAGPGTIGLDPGTVTNVQLNVPFYQLAQGTHEQAQVLIQTALFAGAVDITSLGTVTYTSANTNIVTVNTNGVIYGVGQGGAKITATYNGVSSSLTISVVPPTSVLVNRYSFGETDDGMGNVGATVHDSVSGADGTLPNGGTFAGSQLAIASASRQFVNLPAGVLSNYPALTIEGWVSSPSTLPTTAYYSMYYAFGNTDSGGTGETYIFGSLTRNYACITGTDPGYNAEQGASGGAFAGVTNCHFTAVYNPGGGYIALYQGGWLVGKNLNVTDPMSAVNDVYSYIGRSLYNGDPYPDLQLDEFRIYNGALTSQGVAISDLAGPNAVPSTVTNGPGSLQSLSMQFPATLEWIQAAPIKILANYATLTNFDLAANSVLPLAGLSVTSSDTNVVALGADGQLHAMNPGTATIVGIYQGVTNKGTITVNRSPLTPTLMHRYSFTNDTSDSVGGPDFAGTLVGGASISSDGQLVLPNSTSAAPATDYLELPAGIITNSVNGVGTNANDPAVTVEAWATVYPSQYTWANLFDFGSQDAGGSAAYDIHVCVHASDSGTIVGISDSDNANVDYQFCDVGSGSKLDGSTNMHIVAVFNPPGGYVAIYTNGVLMGSSSITISMAGVVAVLNKVGADNWPDPGMQGSVDELRIYNGVLEPDNVQMDYAAGPNQLPAPKVTLSASVSQGALTLSWPGNATGLTLQSRSSLSSGSWTTVTSPTAQLVNGKWQVTPLPASGLTQFFRLVK
jgi:hypothetical protein